MSWKQYGGTNNFETNKQITTSTIVADEILLKKSYVGGFNVRGLLDVTGRAIIQGNLELYGTFSVQDVSVNFLRTNFINIDNIDYVRNINCVNNIIVGNTIISKDISVKNVLVGNAIKFKDDKYIYSDSSGVGINTLYPNSTFDIYCDRIEGLNIKTDLSSNTNIITSNNQKKGIVVSTQYDSNNNESNTNIDFYVNNQINTNTSDAYIKYQKSRVLEFHSSDKVLSSSNFYISNRTNGVNDNIYNESLVVYDNSNGLYNYDIYKKNINTGDGITIVSKDNSANSFLRMVTPNKTGLAIAGGAYPDDNNKSMTTIGTTDSCGNFIPNQTIVSNTAKGKYKTTLGINTYKPTTEKYVVDINGPLHIDNGEISVVNTSNFEIISMDSKDNFSVAVGSSIDISGTNYTNVILVSYDYGSSWITKDLNGITISTGGGLTLNDIQNLNLNYTLNDVYVYDKNSAIIIGSYNLILVTKDGGQTWNYFNFVPNLNGVYNFKKFAVFYAIGTPNYHTYILAESPNKNQYLFKCFINKNIDTPYIQTYSSVDIPDISINSIDVYYDKNNIANTKLLFATNDGIWFLDSPSTSISQEVMTQVDGTYNYSFNSIKIINTNVIALGGQHVFSADLIDLIDSQIYSNNYSLSKLYIYDSLHYLSISSNKELVYTNDGGITWNPIPDDCLLPSGKKNLIYDISNVSNIVMVDKSTIIVSDVKQRYSQYIQSGKSSIFYFFVPKLFNRVNNNVLDVCGNMSISGSININEGKLISNNHTFDIFNENVIHMNIGGNTSSINIGNIISGNTNILANFYVDKQSIFNGNVLFNSIQTIGNTTQSTDISNGSFIVKGGVGIFGNTNIGGNLNVTHDVSFNRNLYVNRQSVFNGNTLFNSIQTIGNTRESTGVTNGAVVSRGGIGIFGNTNIGGNLNVTNDVSFNSNLYVNKQSVFNGNVLFNSIQTIGNTTESNDISNGSFVVKGGVGVYGNTNIGGNLNITNDVSFNSNLYVNRQSVFNGNVLFNSIQTISNTTESTGVTNGALVSRGGIGIFGNTNIGGNLNVTHDVSFNSNLYVNKQSVFNGNVLFNSIQTIGNTTESTHTTNGALVSRGGVGVYGNTNIGGNLNVTHDVSFNSNLYVNKESVFNGNVLFNSIQTIGNTTESTHTTNGALVSRGGVGVYGNTNIGGNLNVIHDVSFNSNLYVNKKSIFNGNVLFNSIQTIGNVTESTEFTNGALVSRGGVGVYGNTNIGGNLNVIHDVSFNSNLYVNKESIFNGNVLFNSIQTIGNTTESTEFTNGALVSRGGVGVYGNTNIGGNLNVIHDVSFNSNLYVNKKSVFNGNVLFNSIQTIGNTTESTEFTNGALVSRGGVGVYGNTNIGGNLNVTHDVSFNNNLYVNKESVFNGNVLFNSIQTIGNTTESNDIFNGSLVVNGGVGIYGNTNIGGNLNVTHDVSFNSNLYVNKESVFNGNVLFNSIQTIGNTTESTDISNGSLVVNGGVGIYGNTNMGGNLNVTNDVSFNRNLYVNKKSVFNGNVLFNSIQTIGNTTESNDISNGSFIVKGGVGIYGNTNIGGNLNVTYDVSFNSNLYVNKKSVFNGNVLFNSIQTIGNTTESTEFTNGSLVVKGGVGIYGNTNIGGNINIGGNLNVTHDVSFNRNLYVNKKSVFNGNVLFNSIQTIGNTTESTDISNGSLVVKGGVGIYGNTNIGGNLYVHKTTTIHGNLIINTTDIKSIYTSGGIYSNQTIETLENLQLYGNIINKFFNSTDNNIPIIFNDSKYISDIFVRKNKDDLIDDISGQKNFKGLIYLQNESDVSHDTNGGALSISGGVSIQKQLVVNGNITSNGTLITNGNIISWNHIGIGKDPDSNYKIDILGNININGNLNTHYIQYNNKLNIYSNNTDTESILTIGKAPTATNLQIVNIGESSRYVNIGKSSRYVNIGASDVIGDGSILNIGGGSSSGVSSVGVDEVYIGGGQSKVYMYGDIIFRNQSINLSKVIQYSKEILLNHSDPVVVSGLYNFGSVNGGGIYFQGFTNLLDLGKFTISLDGQGFIFKPPTYNSLGDYEADPTLSKQNILKLDVNNLKTNANNAIVIIKPSPSDLDNSKFTITATNFDISNIFVKDVDQIATGTRQSISTDVSLKGKTFFNNNVMVNKSIITPNTICEINGNALITKLGIGMSSVNANANSLEIRGNMYQQDRGYIIQF